MIRTLQKDAVFPGLQRAAIIHRQTVNGDILVADVFADTDLAGLCEGFGELISIIRFVQKRLVGDVDIG